MPHPDHNDAPAPPAPTSALPGDGPAPVARWRWHRRLYDWVLHWADTPHGAAALFLLSFAESSFFPIPPDVLLIALALGARRRWWWFATLCTAGSVAGGVAGYGIGSVLMDSIGIKILQFYHAEEQFAEVRQLYVRYDYWIILAAAFTPIPYKVFTIASGAFDMNLLAFSIVSFFGRGARFFLVALLIYAFGPPIRRLIERYFDIACLLFMVLLVGGFLIIKWLM